MNQNQEKSVTTTPGTQKKTTEVGKRYMCTKCGLEFIVTRGRGGNIRCCGEPVVPKK